MTYINAGHPDLYLINKDDTIENIPSNNLILGVASDYHFRYETFFLQGSICSLLLF